jgi:hypothetical protein
MPRQPVPPEIDPYDDPVEPDEIVASTPGHIAMSEPGPAPTSEQAVVLATVGVLLSEREDEEDPWGFANQILEHNVGREYRQGFLERWLAMVAGKPETERDALLDHGRQIFRYRLDTARKR